MHTFGILFHWIVTLVSRALSRFSLVRLLRQYLVRFQDSLKFDCYVNVSRTFRIPFHPKLSRRHTQRFSTPIAAISDMPDIGDFICRWRRSAKIAITAPTHRAIFARCARDRRIKSLIVSPALVSRTLLGFLFKPLLRQYLADYQDSFLFHCYVSISGALFQDSFSIHCYVGNSRTFRIPFQSIVTLVSRRLLGFLFIPVLRQYLWRAHFRIPFHPIVAFLYRSLVGFLFIPLLRWYLAYFQDSFSFPLLRQYLAHFQDSFSFRYYVNIQRAFKIPFHSIVTFVSRALLGFLFIRLLRQCFTQFQDSFSSECYVSISHTSRVLLHPIVTLVSHALLDSFSSECYVSISRTFGISFHPLVTLVFHALLCSDCYVSISRTFRVLLHPSVTLVSRAL